MGQRDDGGDDRTERRTGERPDKTGWAATGAGVLGALATTSCCVLPLVLVSLGVTGVFIGQLTALYAYKWVTFSVAAAAHGYGFWKAYRPVPAEDCGTGA
ncbi:MAG: mercuric transporter MerT family protein [Nitratireductor sp.]